MSTITTYSGKRIDPMNPDPRLFDIGDIAHSLSLLCRANGHSRYFFSVAQHSINCAKEAVARRYDSDLIMFCFLHDATEAYMSDVTRPVKQHLDLYRKAERELQDAIFERFVGRLPDSEERDAILLVDNLMFSLEFHEYMPIDMGEDYKKIKSSVTCGYENPGNVESEFLGIFDMLVTMNDDYVYQELI